MSYFIRISRTYAEAELFCALIHDNSEGIAVVEHEADEDVNRTHLHICVLSYKKTKKHLIDDTLKKQFPEITATDYSCKAWDKCIQPLVYQLKGNLEWKQFNLDSYLGARDFDEYQQYIQSLWTQGYTKNHLLYNECWKEFVLLPYTIIQHTERKLDDDHFVEAKKMHQENQIAKHARNFVFEKGGLIWSQNSKNQYNMLVDSYKMRLNRV